MIPEITPSVLSLFPEESREKAQALMQKFQDDPRMAHLLKVLSAEKPNYLDLFARGIAHLPATTDDEGSSFASAYFFLLSEIEGLPDEARDFALHASVYADGANAHDPSHRAFGLGVRTTFKENVWPLLA